MTAMCLPLLLGFAGLAVDTSTWRERRAQLQEEVDVAALALAKARAAGLETEVAAQSLLDHQASLRLGSSARLTLASLGDDVVGVRGEARVASVFPKILGKGGLTVRANAEARFGTDEGPGCLLALDRAPSGGRGIYLHNMGFIEASCGVRSNAAGSASIEVYNGRLAADTICHGGGATYPSWAPNSVVGKVKACAPLADPFGGSPAPDPTGAARGNPLALGWGTGAHEIEPGIYPAGLEVDSVTVTMRPGTYHVTGGRLHVRGGGKLTGQGVTIVVWSEGPVIFDNGTTTALAAPEDGGPAFVLRVPGACPSGLVVTGGASVTLDGVLHAPACAFEEDGNARVVAKRRATLVVATARIWGSARLALSGSGAAGTGGGARLVR